MEKEQDGLGAFSGLIPNSPFAGSGDGKTTPGYSEEMTDEELEKIRKSVIDSVEGTDDEEEGGKPKLFEEEEPAAKKKPGRPKKTKPEVIEEAEDEEEEDDEDDSDESLDEFIKKQAKKGSKDKSNSKEDGGDNEESEPDKSDEEVVVEGFFNAMAEKMGWELNEEEEVPKTAEELIEYFADVVEENSKPEYANEEIAKLDEFVRNGGNPKDYFAIDAELDLDDIKLEDNDDTCKKVIKEFLKEKGFSKTQIDKKLQKYEDADLLEDEAEDALEGLKEIREKQKQELLVNQQKEAETAKANQQKLMTDVVTQIKELKDIRGVKIPEKDKKSLIEYIFKPTGNGKTKYHQDYASNYIRNLIESAYFTMNGDTLLNIAKQEGSTSAVNKFKESLNTRRDNVSKKTKAKTMKSSDDSIWGVIAKMRG